MRIEIEDLRNLSFKGIDELCKSLRNKRTKNYISQLYKELGE